MNLDLSDFAATLAIGGGSIFLSLLLLRVFLDIRIPIPVKSTDLASPGYSILLVVSSFGVGVLLEDISDSYADVDNYFFQKVLDFPKEKTIRSQALLGFDERRVRQCEASPPAVGPLGQQFIKTGLLPQQPKVRAEYCAWIKEVHDHSTGSLYYTAKNIVYTEDNYFHELYKIQTRIDFSRSVSIGAAIFGSVIVLLILISVVLFWRDDSSERTETLCNRMRSGLILLTLMLAAHTAGRFAYAAEEREFNLRVFGYYQTLKQIAASKPATPAP